MNAHLSLLFLLGLPLLGTPPEQDPEFNQVYTVTAFQNWIVTGTQAGVVLWDRESKRLHSLRPDFIANSLLVWEGKLWVGAYRSLSCFDGRSWKVYLDRPKSSKTFQLLKGPGGGLIAVHGAKFWRYDPAADEFDPIPSPIPGLRPYHALYDRQGHFYAIDFLRSIRLDGKEIALQSSRYPGTDPRSIIEGADGTIWVVDFESGFFFLDRKSGRFVQEPTVRSKASAVIVDPKRMRTWFLHYTDGLYLKEGSQPPRFFNLRRLHYMRDMFQDDAGDLWIGGWNRLLHFYDHGQGWRQESLTIAGTGQEQEASETTPELPATVPEGHRK